MIPALNFVPLSFSPLKEKLEAKGFKQLEIPSRNNFLRVSPRPWWGYFLPFYPRVVEIFILGHLVWFYEKREVGWDSKTEFKTWDSNQKSLEDFLEKL